MKTFGMSVQLTFKGFKGCIGRPDYIMLLVIAVSQEVVVADDSQSEVQPATSYLQLDLQTQQFVLPPSSSSYTIYSYLT